MSSRSAISTEAFVPGSKLLVNIAENGHSYEFECDGSTPVEAIQRSIESLCGVYISDQLLLCQNTSLDSQHNLSYYKLPQDDHEVFLYNKSKLHADSPQPQAETIDIPNAAIPGSSPSRSPHPLDEASDPALKALASYERQFRYHFQYANSIFGCTRSKFEVCTRLLREMQVQDRALETAQGNLDHTFKKLQQRYTDFIRCFNLQHRSHSDLLSNFERDVERLRSIKLLPLLQSDSRKCLLDLVKEDDLRNLADNCFNSHKKFENKVSQFKLNFGELNRRLSNVFMGMDSASNKDLELLINDHQKVLSDQKSIMQSLSKDVNTVKKLVDDCLNRQLSGSLRPHDAISALGPMYDVHEKNHIPKVQNCDHVITKLLDKSIIKKNEMNTIVHFCMQKVKSAQLSIKDMMNELHAFQEVMGHKEKEFDNLKLVSGISHAYRACLAEVVRRKSSSKLYMGLAGHLAERLAAERESEIRRRNGFCKTWSKYIPHDIMKSIGLFDSPSQCDVNIAPFDINLMDIDMADVDRYAPQSLVGDRIYPATSIENSTLTASQESGVEYGEKVDFDDLIDGYFPLDISGTNRLEVENARLKAELASAIALICTFNAEIEYETFDQESDNLIKTMKEKTVEALHSKDDYIKHIQMMLNTKQNQCLAYEKRINELEHRLKNQYYGMQKGSFHKNEFVSAIKIDAYGGETYGDEDALNPSVSTVSMDAASFTSASIDPKLGLLSTQSGKLGEGGDENMIDFSGMLNVNFFDPAHKVLDASMLEPRHEDPQVCNVNDVRVGLASEDKDVYAERESENKAQFSLTIDNSNVSARVTKLSLDTKTSDIAALDHHSTFAERSSEFGIDENKLKVAMDDICSLKCELEVQRNLLDESQMNCAHLENCLHEAREEARTNLCAAERRASEYNALRSSAVKMHGLFERFRNCVTGLGGSVNFSDSLRLFALSLGSGSADDEDDVSANFRTCILVIADKAGLLIRRVDHLSKQVEEQREMIKNLYRKHQIDKQASKEKISFLHLEVHELAAFVLNTAGNYEAINRNCPNHFLSAESVALFTEHSGRPSYIIGQIVHIEKKQIAWPPASRDDPADPNCSENSAQLAAVACKNPPNRYGLPPGCEYFIVTVAMLPDTIHSIPS